MAMAMASQRCLYDILGVETTASNEEIRSAYLKLALKWHPDKIQQSGATAEEREEATIRFQEIGRAYEVLADPSERSWYDSHRSQILSSSSSSPSDFDFNPWPFFSPSVFAGYGDTGKGFYAVYGEVFSRLHEQETIFANSRGLRPPLRPPSMGNFSTAYPQVQKFYNHWLGFSTVKDFAWCDEFKASLAPNRKLRRLMEEENKKLKSKARKEFSDAIRRLAAFVRKRDKRVLERQIEVQRLEKEKEEVLKARRKKEKEDKKMKARLYEEAEWTKIASDEDAADGSDLDENVGSYEWGQAHSKGNGSKKERQDEFHCIVCNKTFKSNEQWRNHERSKKHYERVAILKESFEEEDEEFRAMSEGKTPEGNARFKLKGSAEPLSSSDTDLSSSGIDEEIKVVSSSKNAIGNNEIEKTLAQISMSKTEKVPVSSESDFDDKGTEEEDGEDDSLFTMVKSYSSKQWQSTNEDNNESTEPSTLGKAPCKENGEVKGEEEEMSASTQRSSQILKTGEICENLKGSLMNQETAVSMAGIMHVELDGETGGSSKKKKSKGQIRNDKQQAATWNRHSKLAEELMHERQINAEGQTVGMLVTNEVESSDRAQESKNDMAMFGKGANCTNDALKTEMKQSLVNSFSQGKKVNGHSRIDLEQQRRPTLTRKSKGNAQSTVLSCETCGEDFDSRNQLFKHLSDTKHASLKRK